MCLSVLQAEGEAAHFIRNADDDTIISMAEVRGMDTGLSASTLRSALLEQLGEGDILDEVVEEEGGYSLEIVHADNMDVTQSGLVMLSGDVEVSFTLEGDETGRTLESQRMILDPEAGRLTAYGGVTYRDGDEKSGMEKRTPSYMLVQAADFETALKNLNAGMKGTMADWTIVSITETPLMDVYPFNAEGKPQEEDRPKE